MLKRFLTVTLLVAVIYLLPLPWSAALRDITIRTVRPMGSYFIKQNAGLFNTYNSLKQLGGLREDKSKLEHQVVSLQQQLAEKESVSRENEMLRKELGVTGVTREQKKSLASIIVEGSDKLDRTLTVDIGSSEGVAVGQAAVANGTLVGKVISVREHSAIIRTLSSSKSQIQAWISNNREKGRVVGTGTGIELQDITQGVAAKEGDIIETSSLGGSLPQGILIGEISGVRSKQSETSQTFAVKAASDPQGLESVFIILGD